MQNRPLANLPRVGSILGTPIFSTLKIRSFIHTESKKMHSKRIWNLLLTSNKCAQMLNQSIWVVVLFCMVHTLMWRLWQHLAGIPEPLAASECLQQDSPCTPYSKSLADEEAVEEDWPTPPQLIQSNASLLHSASSKCTRICRPVAAARQPPLSAES